MRYQFIKGPVGPDGYNWADEPFRRDPLTERLICRDCWGGKHGLVESANYGHTVCKIDGCHCGCKESIENQAVERWQKRKNSAERRALLHGQLADPENPLRAENPSYKPKKRNRREIA